MRLRKFNEEIGNPSYPNQHRTMKQFVLTTSSESSDHYIYFIEHTQLPTNEELNKFLVEQGNDTDGTDSYENIDKCVEIKDFNRIN
jgi:hypothetical protein